MPLRRILCLLTILPLPCTAAGPEKKIIGGVTYHLLKVAPEAIKILWKNDKGQALRTFAKAADHLESQGYSVQTVMNGGIFEPGGIPSGLLIQDGQRLRQVNRKTGRGNFYLKPNGIFLINPEGAFIIPTHAYPVKDRKARQAVQSGPLLLHNGKIHPQFNARSKSHLHRNGVGVLNNGKVLFAMTDFHSDKLPNLYEFAQLFKTLGCANALFLDGDLSQMKSGRAIDQPNNNFGSIIAIVEGKK